MKEKIITLLVALMACQYIFAQNITLRDSTLTYLKENSKELDKIEGIWDLNVVRTLYKNDSIIAKEFDENRSQWGIIRKNESTFKVVDINNLRVDDSINEIEATFEKVPAKNTYFYKCHFKNIDWLKIAIADFWNERTIHYSYYVSKSYMEHIYGPNYDPTLQLHWEFYWVKKEEIKITKVDAIEKVAKPIKKVDYEAIYNSLVSESKPEITSEKEFNNFKSKSNYIDVIEAYDLKNPPELFGGKKYADNISYYDLPTEINTQKYTNNSILFGDINNDNKRDCIISVLRSDGYNEVTFFYVFINYGTTFKLENVANEDTICGCKKEGWPHRFRYQKIEDGYLKGVSECHYKDAHCCPSLYFKTKVKFTDGKLEFHSAEFVMDNAIKYRSTPEIDSVLIKK